MSLRFVRAVRDPPTKPAAGAARELKGFAARA